MKKLVLFSMTVLSLVSLSRSIPLRPFVTCPGCETFFQCFFLCPGERYPGLDSNGIYDPPGSKDDTENRRSDRKWERKGVLKHNYENYKPYDGSKYKDYHIKMLQNNISEQMPKITDGSDHMNFFFFQTNKILVIFSPI